MRLDCLVIVPVEPTISPIMEPMIRRTQLAKFHGPMFSAFFELERFVGRPLALTGFDNHLRFGDDLWPEAPIFGGSELLKFRSQAARRSLSAIALGTCLEEAGLRWHAIDPGIQELSYWRERLKVMQDNPPLTIAIATTFLVGEHWVNSLCSMVRELLPRTKLLIGGYYYAIKVSNFLSLDADVMCIGEGELRLPQIVKTIKDHGDLSAIPGLYLRDANGMVESTGRSEPLNLNDLPTPDWSLSSRIEPPLDLNQMHVSTWAETQRGCVFKCEFCDYRTIALPNVMTAEHAVERILSAAIAASGSLRITDATATFPRDRWERMMELLIEKGGSPVPIWAYARVSDISDRTAELMVKANVKHVFVGQESGDQRILVAMKKGTSIRQVKPAVAAMAKHGVGATFAFIHGFPGETTETMQATRDMIVHLNDGHERKPPVLQYLVQPLGVIEFASVSQREEMKDVDHWMGYQSAELSPERAMTEVYDTVVAASRVPHAPAFMLTPGSMPVYWEEFFFFSPHRYDIHRWYKAVERGTVLFMQRAVEGKQPDDRELRDIKQTLLRYQGHAPIWKSLLTRAKAGIGARIFGRVSDECNAEHQAGPGLVTRLMVASSALKDTRQPKFAYDAFQLGQYPKEEKVATSQQANKQRIDELSSALVAESHSAESRERQKVHAKKLKLVPMGKRPDAPSSQPS